MDETEKKLDDLLFETLDDSSICVSEDLIAKTIKRIQSESTPQSGNFEEPILIKNENIKKIAEKKPASWKLYLRYGSVACLFLFLFTSGIAFGLLRDWGKNEKMSTSEPFVIDNTAGVIKDSPKKPSVSMDNSAEVAKNNPTNSMNAFEMPESQDSLKDMETNDSSSKQPLATQAPDVRQQDKSSQSVVITESLYTALNNAGYSVVKMQGELTGESSLFTELRQNYFAEQLERGVTFSEEGKEKNETGRLFLQTESGTIVLEFSEDFFRIYQK